MIFFGDLLNVDDFLKILSFWSFLDEPTVVTLDQSTLHRIPNHVEKLILGFGERSPTKIDLMNAFVIASGLETGFIGDWCCDANIEATLSAYQINWSYMYDRRLLMDFAIMKPESQPETFKFKFILKPEIEILVHCFESGDLMVISARLVDNSVINSTKTLAIPLSRYIIRHKFDFKNLPFRNLQELSINLKNEIFLPLRNNIFQETKSEWLGLYPSLHGINFDLHRLIIRYLNKKDIASLSATCKMFNQIIKELKETFVQLSNKKRQKMLWMKKKTLVFSF